MQWPYCQAASWLGKSARVIPEYVMDAVAWQEELKQQFRATRDLNVRASLIDAQEAYSRIKAAITHLLG